MTSSQRSWFQRCLACGHQFPDNTAFAVGQGNRGACCDTPDLRIYDRPLREPTEREVFEHAFQRVLDAQAVVQRAYDQRVAKGEVTITQHVYPNPERTGLFASYLEKKGVTIPRSPSRYEGRSEAPPVFTFVAFRSIDDRLEIGNLTMYFTAEGQLRTIEEADNGAY